MKILFLVLLLSVSVSKADFPGCRKVSESEKASYVFAITSVLTPELYTHCESTKSWLADPEVALYINGSLTQPLFIAEADITTAQYRLIFYTDNTYKTITRIDFSHIESYKETVNVGTLAEPEIVEKTHSRLIEDMNCATGK